MVSPKWYELGSILSHRNILNFVVGQRGGGKTVACIKWVTKGFIDSGDQFVWVRRYKSEMKEIKRFFDDMIKLGYFEGHKLEVRGNKAYIDNEIAGYFIPLSVADNFKSQPFHNVRRIVFDEFITTKQPGYIKDEVNVFLSLLDTIIRIRDDVRCILVGNNLTLTNPYFIYFSIPTRFNKDKIYSKNGVSVEYYKSQEFIDFRKETRFGQLISTVEYGQMSLENDNIGVTNDFIAERPKGSKFRMGLRYNGKVYGLWYDYDSSKYYCSYKYDPDGRIFSLTSSDHMEKTLFIKSFKNYPSVKQIKQAYALGCICYEDNYIKEQFFEIMSLL